jgi:metallo-beta-lactamase family protein
MKITFHGGARQVTGSKHLIETTGERVLLDCGFFQGHRAEANEKNRNLPFDPSSINAVILGHAHIDHSGNLPSLVRNGFEGPIYSTKPTDDLCAYMLTDAAYIQEKDAEFLNKKNEREELELIEPVYSITDALDAIQQFVPRPYSHWFGVTKNIRAIFRDAGHILGSAVVELEISDKGRRKKVCYAVDLGRKNLPLLLDPKQVTGCETLIIESTYGNRNHDAVENAKGDLAEAINRTYTRGGKTIVPSFAMERTQEIIYNLHELHREGAIPNIPIYIDSPLAINVTQVFRRNFKYLDDEAQEMIRKYEDPFGFGKITYVRSVEDSKLLNRMNEPMIIISASGMCEAGRILHHLKNNIEDKRNTILVVGYMAENTLGRRIVERHPKVKIFGEEYNLRAEVVKIDAFSSHADKDELLNYVRGCGQRLKRVFVVHGEEEQSLIFADAIREMNPALEVVVPEEGYTAEI